MASVPQGFESLPLRHATTRDVFEGLVDTKGYGEDVIATLGPVALVNSLSELIEVLTRLAL